MDVNRIGEVSNESCVEFVGIEDMMIRFVQFIDGLL